MKLLIVANWKMNPQTLAEARKIFNSVKRGIKNIKGVEVVFCPPFPYLSFIKSGAQNMFYEEKGAYTGEISPLMLKDLGIKYVILGHSERRKYFGETDQMINKKIKAAIKAGLRPIFCIGESLEERERTETTRIIESQIKEGLQKITRKEMRKMIIAYEPVWAIGTGIACDVREAQTMSLFIRKIIAQLYGRIVARNLPILYGGSVTSENAPGYIKEAKMNGLLVGGASLNPDEFIKIIKVCSGP